MSDGQNLDMPLRQDRRADLAAPVYSVPQVIEENHEKTNLTRSLYAALTLGVDRVSGSLGRWRSSFANAKEEEQRYGHGFLFVPVFLGSGSLVWFSLANAPRLANLALLMCVFGMAAFAMRHRSGLLSGSVRAVAFLSAGMFLAAFETARIDTVILDTPVTTTVTGRVLGRETTDKGYWRYRVSLQDTREPHLKRPPETVTLLSRSKTAPIEIGRLIEGRARLSPPSGPALSGLNDFAFDSYFKGIGAVGYFYGKPLAAPAGPSADAGEGPSRFSAVKETIARWREAIGARIRTTIGGDAGAIAAALITAEERAIRPDTVEALRQAGLAHVLAISGLNMVLAAGTLLIGARTLLSLLPGLAHRFPIKKLAAGGALLMVFAYILISGGAVSAVRSWIMISIMLIAVFFDRPSISLRNVALSAIVILVVTPSAVTGPGFQMSFAATLALVAGYAWWRERPGRADGSDSRSRGALFMVKAFFAGLLLSSLIGGLSTLIYSAGHFHRLAAYGLLGNMLAMPIISVFVMPFALIAMLLMPFGLDRLPLMVMGQGLEWMIVIARTVSSWGGEVTTGRLPESAFLLIAAGGVLACLLRTRLAVVGLVVTAAGVVAIGLFPVPRPDVLVSEDGRMIAILAQGTAATNRNKPSDFIYAQWQRALDLQAHRKPLVRGDLTVPEIAPLVVTLPADANARPVKPPIDAAKAREALRRLFAETPRGRFACVAGQFCGANAFGLKIAAVEDARFVGAACDGADLVVTPAMLRIATCKSGARLITGRSLRRSGALEIFADTDPRGRTELTTVPSVSGSKHPWARHRTYDWRSDTFEAVEPSPGEFETNL